MSNSNEVKIDHTGKAIYPVCGKAGEYKAGGQACSESEWVWENGRLIAVPKR